MSHFPEAAPRFVVKRDTPKGMEFLCKRNGYPREFSSEAKARAALSKAGE